MADVIVFWDDAPAPEDLFPMRTKSGRPYRNTLGHYHCGCCPNCRCTPMPLVFVEDLKFPVRVYTNGKIIRMNQGDFDRLYREKSGKLGKSLPNLSEEKPKVSLVSDEMTSEELSRKAKEQKRDDKGRFSKEGKTGQKNQEERKEPEERKKFDNEKERLISGALIPDTKEANIHAVKYYGLVRSMKTDVHNIYKNICSKIDISKEQLQEIKNYLFVDKHDLGDGRFDNFDPCVEIAQSWQRLIEGKNIQEHDLTLLRHELMERQLVSEGYTQDEAHIITSMEYNYDKESADFYGKIKKYK